MGLRSFLCRKFCKQSGYSSTTNYVNYANDVDIPMPGLAPDVLMYNFVVEADYNKLMAICNERLNLDDDQPTKYYPISEHIIFSFSKFEDGKTLVADYNKPGLVRETAFQIFMPVVECKKNIFGKWTARRFMIHLPFIVVNSSFTLIPGREQLGFPKSLANFDFPDDPHNANKFGVDAFGFQAFDKINPQHADYSPLIGVIANNVLSANSYWSDFKEAWKEIVKHLNLRPKKNYISDLLLIFNELEDIFSEKLPMIFLKQFRDATDSSKSCYTAIVEGNAELKSFKKGWFLSDDYTIQIHEYASFPLCEMFGIPATIKPSFGFWVKADLVFAGGPVVYRP